MEFVVSRDPRLPIHYLIPSLSSNTLPEPVKGSSTSYHFWARNALFHGLRALGLEAGDKVLVPAFHCSTMVDPILHYGCEVVFYNVHRDGIVDFEDLSWKIDRQTKAIVAIHYFGVLQPLQKIREFCHHHHLFFIEDCAHLFMGESDGQAIGSVGDISIFSWRKFLPIYDGGILVCNTVQSQGIVPWKKLDGLFHVKIVKNLFEKYLSDRSNPIIPVVASQDKHEVVKQGSVSQEGSNTELPVRRYSADFEPAQLNWPMSEWSRFILKKIDLSEVVQQRHENSNFLYQALRGLPGVRPWSATGVNRVCAWVFPLVVEDRTDLHVQLRKRGIQAFSWDGVIHPRLPLEEFHDAKFLYEHLVLLPNHQSLTNAEMHFVIDSMKEVL